MEQTIQEQENEIIKQYFKDNTKILKSIKSLFFGLEVSEAEKQTIKQIFQDENLKTAFRKNFYSKLGDDVVIEKIGDFWTGIDVGSMLGSSPEYIKQVILSRQLALESLEKSMLLLTNPDGEKVDLSFDPNSLAEDPYAIKFLARSKFMSTVSAGLNIINILANTKAKTQEEVLKNLKKNSSK